MTRMRDRQPPAPIELKPLRKPTPRAALALGPIPMVAIALVRNEADIISAWTSHVFSVFDALYIADHGSSDGTREFLVSLAQGRQDLHVYAVSEQGYVQQEVTNELARTAVEECGGCWLFPLDADEFIPTRSAEEIRGRLKALAPENGARLWWRNALPVRLVGDECFDLHSVCLTSPRRGAFRKLAIHSSSFVRQGWRFRQGNHDLEVIRGGSVSEEALVDIGELIHVPIRGADHFALKCVQGFVAYAALDSHRRDLGQGTHYSDMMLAIVEAGRLDLDRVRGFISSYGLVNGQPAQPKTQYSLLDAGWTCGPLDAPGTSPWPEAERKAGFKVLAHDIVRESPDELVESFLNAVFGQGLSDPTQVIRARLRRCADNGHFGRLPEERHRGAVKMDDVAFIRSLTAKAFSLRENPMPSAWEAHVPFMYCLIDFLRPRRFVELGTHYGNSFFAACQGSRDGKTGTECIAIDTWDGDSHTGRYDEEVFKSFVAALNRDYGDVGWYIRKDFEEACHQFEAGAIDLLHIDGLHTLEAVLQDFEMWLPKLSESGVVLFHDTQVRERDFGVYLAWEKLREEYPSFEFDHGNGLGVLLVGMSPSLEAQTLFQGMESADVAGLLKHLFSSLGGLSPIRSNVRNRTLEERAVRPLPSRGSEGSPITSNQGGGSSRGQDPDDSCIFVVAQGRSGSTLLLELLNEIEGMNICGENWGAVGSLAHFYESLRKTMASAPPQGKADVMMPYAEILERGLKPAWYNVFDHDAILADLRHLLRRMYNPGARYRRWGFKEIRFGLGVDYELFEGQLDFLLHLFPQAKFIFHSRMLESLVQSGWWKEDPELARAKLIRQQEFFERYIGRRYTVSYAMTYEHLIQADARLEGLYSFLGEKFDRQACLRVLARPIRD